MPDNPKPAPETPKKKTSWWEILKKGGELIDKVRKRLKDKKGGEGVKLPDVKVPKGPSSPWPRLVPLNPNNPMGTGVRFEWGSGSGSAGRGRSIPR